MDLFLYIISKNSVLFIHSNYAHLFVNKIVRIARLILHYDFRKIDVAVYKQKKRKIFVINTIGKNPLQAT